MATGGGCPSTGREVPPNDGAAPDDARPMCVAYPRILELLQDSAIVGAADPGCRSQRLESADDQTFTSRRRP
jgi:hypothetical protein